MIFYRHGSDDSLDEDIVIVLEKIPDKKTCIDIINNESNVDKNIITIKNGIVKDVFMGKPDEINNSILYTYNMHNQEYPLLINRPVKRDLFLKSVRVNRFILTILSRSIYREKIKKSIKKGYFERINCMKEIDFNEVNYSELNKKMSEKDIIKNISFQLCQACGLIDGIEIYTKKDCIKYFENQYNYIYRIDTSNFFGLNELKDKLYEYMKGVLYIPNRNGELMALNNGLIFNIKKEVYTKEWYL